MPGRPTDPISVPAWAWESEETVELLADRDVAGLLRFVRQYGGASQTRLAVATGISQGRISEIMNGRKVVTAFDVIERIADGVGMPDAARIAFGLAPRVTPGAPVQRLRQNVPMPLPWLSGIAAALTRYRAQADTTETRSPPELLDAVDVLKADYQGCRYVKVATELPSLLAETEHAGDSVALAAIYHVTASVLLKGGQSGLAWVAADRAIRAAERSGDPLAVGTSARILVRALMRDQHHHAAANLAMDSSRHITERTPEALSVYGSLMLTGATAAAMAEDRDTAATMLDEATGAGHILGRDLNIRWTGFGPTNVELHRVNISVKLGDAGAAVERARRIDLHSIDLIERRAALLVDVGRAFTQWGKLDRAYEALATAGMIAPEELSARPAARALLSELGERSTGHLHAQVTELAGRTAR